MTLFLGEKPLMKRLETSVLIMSINISGWGKVKDGGAGRK